VSPIEGFNEAKKLSQTRAGRPKRLPPLAGDIGLPISPDELDGLLYPEKDVVQLRVSVHLIVDDACPFDRTNELRADKREQVTRPDQPDAPTAERLSSPNGSSVSLGRSPILWSDAALERPFMTP
jgi:hypothetical protein